MSRDVKDPDRAESGFMPGEYAAFAEFAEKNPGLDYYRLDWCCVHELNLFALRENVDFDAIGQMTDRLTEALPAIRRILAHPTMYLKVTEDILPVESVQVINNRTVDHAAVHSELWDNVTEDDRLIPRRLLTLRNQDDYAIYENVALTWLLTRIISYLRRHITLCRDLLYADRVLDMNVLERSNHLYHYLALGKIHTGYIRGFERYRDVTERCLGRLMYLYNTLVSRMGCPLVTACRPYIGRFSLHRSNLFRMHRDYHAVYDLCRHFSDLPADDLCPTDDPADREGYRVFCGALTLFAAGHFNFTADRETRFSLNAPDVRFTFGKWSLAVSTVRAGDADTGLLLSFDKDVGYRILLIPAFAADTETDDPAAALRRACPADEYVILTEEPGGDACRVSLSDIESFRRLQQHILRGMIKADRTYDTCPFCGHPMSAGTEPYPAGIVMSRVCPSCRTVITERECPETGARFMATEIDGPGRKSPAQTEDTVRKSAWVYERVAEGSMHYRNVTPVTAACDVICPHCGKVHV